MIDFTWSSPQQYLTGNSKKWRREYIIPPEMMDGFFNFWRKNKFALLSQGFSVGKNKSGKWVFYETKNDISLFKDFNLEPSKLPVVAPEAQVIFNLPEYKLKNIEGLRPWQIDAAEKLVSAINYWGGAVDGSEMGVGKSYSAMGTVRDLDVPFVIVCPKAMINPWKEVIYEHFKLSDKCVGIINYELLIRGRKDSDVASFVLKRGTGKRQFTWKLPKNTIIIFDEAHKLKNFKTKSSKCCIEAYKQGYKILFLSATLASSPIDLKTVGICLKMFKNGQSYYDWLNRHGTFKAQWGMEFNNDPKVLKKIHTYLFEERGILKKRDEIPNFPVNEIIIQSYNINEDKVTEINKNYAAMSSELKRINKLLKNEESQLVIRLRYRQRIELLKVDLFVELAEQALESGMSVLLFMNYTETIHALMEKLKTKCIYSGQVTDVEKKKHIEEFQSNKERVIIIQCKSGNAGIGFPDLDGKHPRCSIISPDDSAVVIQQCCGRGSRESSKSTSLVQIPFCTGTIEDNVVTNLKSKSNNIAIINDSDLKII